MSRSAASPAAAGKPRKSPLRLATAAEPSFPARRDARLSPEQLRAMMISEFEQWLRSRTNQEKRPFQEETVVAYAKAARARTSPGSGSSSAPPTARACSPPTSREWPPHARGIILCRSA
jgi:hypothetical protein